MNDWLSSEERSGTNFGLEISKVKQIPMAKGFHLLLQRGPIDDALPPGTLGFSPYYISVVFVEATQSGPSFRALRVDQDGEFLDRWPKGFSESGPRNFSKLKQYAVKPSVMGQSWEQFRYLLGSFGFERGRLVAQLPNDWEKQVMQAIEESGIRETDILRIVERRGNAKSQRALIKANAVLSSSEFPHH